MRQAIKLTVLALAIAAATAANAVDTAAQDRLGPLREHRLRFVNTGSGPAEVAAFSDSTSQRWPSGRANWHVPNDDRDYEFHILCRTGEHICVGGTTASGTFWGIGIANDHPKQPGSCFRCGEHYGDVFHFEPRPQ